MRKWRKFSRNILSDAIRKYYQTVELINECCVKKDRKVIKENFYFLESVTILSGEKFDALYQFKKNIINCCFYFDHKKLTKVGYFINQDDYYNHYQVVIIIPTDVTNNLMKLIEICKSIER